MRPDTLIVARTGMLRAKCMQNNFVMDSPDQMSRDKELILGDSYIETILKGMDHLGNILNT